MQEYLDIAYEVVKVAGAIIGLLSALAIITPSKKEQSLTVLEKLGNLLDAIAPNPVLAIKEHREPVRLTKTKISKKAKVLEALLPIPKNIKKAFGLFKKIT